jgi:hypothetical protein
MSKKMLPELRATDVDRFLKLQAQMQELLARITAISSKAPDQVINKFKLAVINEQLNIANDILVGQARPFASFELFDEAALPSNSDVVVVLSQYLTCLENWRSEHIVWNSGDYSWKWNVDSKVIKTDPPRNRG